MRMGLATVAMLASVTSTVNLSSIRGPDVPDEPKSRRRELDAYYGASDGGARRLAGLVRLAQKNRRRRR